MIFDHARYEIWNLTQHPFKHSLAEFAYSNPAYPGVTNVEGVINWITKVLYPNTKPSVATVAALPAAGNVLNDYRVVLDDGDGKAASYRWEQREGEATPSWHKVYDMDWGQDSILAAFQNQTQDLYVWQAGRSQLDGAGVPITGLYAGQTVIGGVLANENLTLRANSGDGVGARTGFVQVDDQFRPTLHNTFDIGTNGLRFRDLFIQNSAIFGTLTLQAGVITDSSGAISFDNENLTTTGNISGSILTASTSLVTGTVTISSGNIIDSGGAISFGASNLVTTGTIAAASGSVLGNITFTTGSIVSASGGLTFGANNLSTTGTLAAGNTTVSQIIAGNLSLIVNTLASTNVNGDINLNPNGTGIINLQKNVTSLGITATGAISATVSVSGGNLQIAGNVLSSTDTNGNINLNPNGAGILVTSAPFLPSTNNTLDLGSSAFRFNDLFLGGVLSNGTDNIAIPTILTLRSVLFRDAAETQPVQNGDALFYDTASGKWLANHPDTEILHSEISGLTTGDAGHTQFVMLSGRTGGQAIQGGTTASENLFLESTSNATKGNILFKDSVLPFTNASFSGTWSGLDLGSATNNIRDIYTRGELKGARLENYTSGTLPASSGQNIGRVVWATDTNKAFVDNGVSLQVLGVAKFSSDLSFDGVVVLKDTTVSSTIVDARSAIWQLKNNANNFEVMGVTIQATSASNVRITTGVPLPAGSYRLIGLE